MIYKYKTKRRSPEDFSNYQNLIGLFKDLGDVNINPRKVLKNQTDFKSHLDQRKKGNPKSKSKDQTSVIQNSRNAFDFRGKIIDFFRDYSILLSKGRYKAKHGKGVKILTPKQMLQRLPISIAQVKADDTSENLLNQIDKNNISSAWSKRNY